MTRPTVLLALTLAVPVLVSAPTARAAPIFFEGFDGGFSQAWASTPGTLPPVSLVPFRPQTVSHAGPPGFSFGTVGGAGVVRLNTTAAPSWTRFGFQSAATVPGGSFQVEARINTLSQGGPNIDGLFDLWLLNSSDPSKYVQVGLFGDQFASQRSWYAHAAGEPFGLSPFPFASDTWYKLRITQRAGEDLEVSVWNDVADALLASHRFGFQLGALGSEFRIGFSQWMGGPNRTNAMLSAVDYIQVQAVPEPHAVVVAAVAATFGAGARLVRRRRPVSGSPAPAC